MPTVADYVAKRADLLAQVVLTRRKDVRVLPLGDKDDVGIDFFVHLMEPIAGLPVNPYFGIQVKGTSSPLEDEKAANRFATQVARGMAAQAFILAPIVLMVFSMAGDRGYWGWIMEPSTEGPNDPSLTRTERIHMTEIDDDSLEELFSRITAWFETMGEVLLRHQTKK